eukprot:scaffold63948_cov33-Phaeocystis_antarctica.AAC.1
MLQWAGGEREARLYKGAAPGAARFQARHAPRLGVGLELGLGHRTLPGAPCPPLRGRAGVRARAPHASRRAMPPVRVRVRVRARVRVR